MLVDMTLHAHDNNNIRMQKLNL